MALTLTNDILKFRESPSDPWEKLLIQANMNFNLIYPVGSIYMSTVNVDPGTIFGGTWEQLKDTFLLGAGDSYTAGDTGGEATHTLTVDEMPSHRHSLLTGDGTINDYVGGSSASYGLKSGGAVLSGNFLSASGGGQAHNNMPPYIVVYMWKRLTLSPTIYTPPASVLIGDVASQDIVPVSMGGTGADNAADARTNLGLDAMTSTLIKTAMTSNVTATVDFDDYDILIFACTNSSTRVYGTTVIPSAFLKNGTVGSVYVYGGSTSYVAQFAVNSITGVITCTLVGSGIYGAIYGMSLE